MALDASTLARAIVDSFTGRRFRRAFPVWKEIIEEYIEHFQAELELVNYDKAWDNFDKDDLNLHTFTVLTTRTSSQTSYTVGNTSDEIVFQDTGGGIGVDFTITLPSSPFPGQSVIIKDTSGNALVRNIDVQGNGNNIDGAGSASIIVNHGVLQLRFASSNWYILHESL
jgi:hypothetical protein